MTDEPLPDTYLVPALGALTEEIFTQLHCLDHERLLKGGQGIVDPRIPSVRFCSRQLQAWKGSQLYATR